VTVRNETPGFVERTSQKSRPGKFRSEKRKEPPKWAVERENRTSKRSQQQRRQRGDSRLVLAIPNWQSPNRQRPETRIVPAQKYQERGVNLDLRDHPRRRCDRDSELDRRAEYREPIRHKSPTHHTMESEGCRLRSGKLASDSALNSSVDSRCQPVKPFAWNGFRTATSP
jgi:hypothetical protein